MTDAFISYSRKDIAFARLIREALLQSKIEPWIDWERIPVGAHWWQEICEAIENANVFIFIISATSISSHVCKDEINHALKNNKRIIPIIVDELEVGKIKEFVAELPQINWIQFKRDQNFSLVETPGERSQELENTQVALPKSPQFEEALARLNEAIHTDWDWVKFHTKLQLDALRWGENQKNPRYLLKDVDWAEVKRLLIGNRGFYNISQAKEHRFDFEKMLLQRGFKKPELTPIQIEYLQMHRDNELSTLQWYWHQEDGNEYHAMDHDFVCYRCDYIYVFTPVEHEPIPKECPACGFPKMDGEPA